MGASWLSRIYPVPSAALDPRRATEAAASVSSSARSPASCPPEGRALASNWTAGLVNVACPASRLAGHSDSCITSLMRVGPEER